MSPLPNPANEIMKLKTDLAAARAAAEEKQKIHNEQMAAVRAAAEEKESKPKSEFKKDKGI